MQCRKKQPYFDRVCLSFYQDLSHRTLMQRSVLHPLLETLCKARIIYRWGFPFSFQAEKNGQSLLLCTKDVSLWA